MYIISLNIFVVRYIIWHQSLGFVLKSRARTQFRIYAFKFLAYTMF